MPINKLGNLDEMDKSLEKQRLVKLTQLEYSYDKRWEWINHQKLTTKKRWGPDDHLIEF